MYLLHMENEYEKINKREKRSKQWACLGTFTKSGKFKSEQCKVGRWRTKVVGLWNQENLLFVAHIQTMNYP